MKKSQPTLDIYRNGHRRFDADASSSNGSDESSDAPSQREAIYQRNR
jgi:hypothetical protein